MTHTDTLHDLKVNAGSAFAPQHILANQISGSPSPFNRM